MDIVDFVILIAIVIGIGYAYFTLTHSKKADKQPESMTVQQRIETVREAIKDPKVTLSEVLKNKIKKYKDLDVQVDSDYLDWGQKSDKLGHLCLDGIKFLDYYLVKKDLTVLKIVDAYITKVMTKLNEIEGEIKENPWSGSWYPVSVYLTRFLASYVYIGTNESLIEDCKRQVLRLLPAVGWSLGKQHFKFTLVQVTIPRLCVNFFNETAFTSDIRTEKFQEVEDFLNLKKIETDEIENGYYEDGSIIIDHVASYERFITVSDFYEPAFRGMGLKTNLKELAVSILPKLTHPDIPWCPLGLFRTSGDRRAAKIWELNSLKVEISLIPFIGLGVFKCESFMFFVRVQRPGISASHSDKAELAVGSVQIRRIFWLGKMYPAILDKNNLKEEPGVLWNVDGSFGKLTESYNECDDINSFVGQLEGLMFWKNSYKFSKLYGDLIISEAGVITKDGLQAYYKIVNNTAKVYKFRYLDSVNNFAVNNLVPSSSIANGCIEVRRGTKEFTWNMATKATNFDVQLEDNGMKFKMEGKEYKIEVTKTNEQYLIKHGKQIVLFGSSSSISNDQMTYDNQVYKRDPKTLMYKLK